MTVPGDATTGEAWTDLPDDYRYPERVEVAEWRRLDSPEPSDTERVEAAHQRMHEAQGTVCPRDRKLPPNVFAPSFTCQVLDLAYAALDVDDPTLTEMPWRAK